MYQHECVKKKTPINNNDFYAHFEQADDAPDDCNSLFDQGGSDDEGEVNGRIDALCIPALQAIKDKCTWNGGEVRNICGMFKYQSTPRGYQVVWGSPQG